MAYFFDFTNKKIHVQNPQTDVDILDLLNAIRDAEASEMGIQYGKIADASGKEQLGEEVRVGVTVQLLDWQVQFWEGNYIAKIAGGNLVGGVAGDPVAYTAGVQVLLIQSAASTVVNVSTGSGLSQTEHDQLMALPDPGDIWAENQAGEKLDLIHDIEGGKWTIVGTQMVFFKADNLTEVARFDLFDADGNPTVDDAFTRRRV